jgi:DNA-directed RNA polymerase subunit E'/Rpb7
MAASNSRIDNKTNGSVYVKSILTKDLMLSYQNIGSNLKNTLQKKLSYDIEGKCDVDGFVKPDSCKIITYSSGTIKGNNINISVVFECLLCSPVEGMMIPCVIKNITKAGIKAEYEDSPSPVTVFLTRDHHYNNMV